MNAVRILCWSLLLLMGCANIGNEITQYIVIKKGQTYTPLARITYKIFPERQEVIYWVEVPGEKRSSLYKLKHCKIVDSSNWEGEREDDFVPFATKVEYVNAEFNKPIFGNNVDWFNWHFNTEPKPSGWAFFYYSIIGLVCFWGFILYLKENAKQIKEQERKAKEIKEQERKIEYYFPTFVRFGSYFSLYIKERIEKWKNKQS